MNDETDEITAALACPTTSFWLRQSLEQALTRDCVDAANDAEHLSNLLAARCSSFMNDETDEITAVLACPVTSFWLRQSLEQAITRDCVDAANDAEHLSKLLSARCCSKVVHADG